MVKEWNEKHGCLDHNNIYKDDENLDNYGIYLEAFENGKKLRMFKLGSEGIDFVKSVGGLNSDTMRLISTTRGRGGESLNSSNPSKIGDISKLSHNQSQSSFWYDGNTDR